MCTLPNVCHSRRRTFFVSDFSDKLTMTDLDLLQNAEFKEAFDEFDKVRCIEM